MPAKLSTKQFIEKAQVVHKNFYNYSLTNYTLSKNKVIIICPKHGQFNQTANDHLSGYGCAQCAEVYSYTNKEFEEKAIKVHGNKYDYSLVNYINNHTKIKIICPKHGIFEQQPANHLNSKQGCKSCGIIKLSNSNRKKDYNILNELNQTFQNKNYKFDISNYKNNMSSIKIICPKHGEFIRKYTYLLKSKIGCPECCLFGTKGETEIKNYLNLKNIEYIREYSFENCRNPKTNSKLYFDFYLPKQNICIEYNGKQHYKSSELFGGEKEFENIKFRDQIKNEYCLKNNIKLIIIKYTDNLKSIITNII